MDEEINKIADHYGFTSQANMLIEESAEFTQAVCKLRQQLEEVTQKHWNECRQIAHYADENKRMKEQIEQLIKEYEKC